MRRIDIHSITFIARCESGLHIGGSQDELVIGGSDNPVIKNPATGHAVHTGLIPQGKDARRTGETVGQVQSGETVRRPAVAAEESCAVCRLFGAHMNTQEHGSDHRGSSSEMDG